MYASLQSTYFQVVVMWNPCDSQVVVGLLWSFTLRWFQANGDVRGESKILGSYPYICGVDTYPIVPVV